GPLTVLDYLNKFLDEYEINIEKKKNQPLVDAQKEEDHINLYEWIYIKTFLPNNFSKICETLCNYLVLNEANDNNTLIFNNDWENFLITNNEYFEFIDGWYSSTNSISLRLKFPIHQKGYFEVLQPSFSKDGYLWSLKKIVIENHEFLIDILLKNTFLPLYFLLYEEDDNRCKVFCLPFPSLLRNGMHYSELLFINPNLDLKDAITSYTNQLFKNIIIWQNKLGEIKNNEYLIVDKLFLDNYDIYTFFKSLSIKYKDYKLCSEDEEKYKNVIPSLNNLTRSASLNKDKIDYSLLINKFNFSPIYILSHPSSKNINTKKYKIPCFNIKGYDSSENIQNIENTSINELNIKNKEEFSDTYISDPKVNNLNKKCIFIIHEVFCEHKLLILFKNLLEQKLIDISNIIIVSEQGLPVEIITKIINNFDHVKKIISILSLPKLILYLREFDLDKASKVVFLSSNIKLNNCYTISYLLGTLESHEEVSNISCGINTFENYINSSLIKHNKFSLQINIPNLLNNANIELQDIDLNLSCFIEYFSPISNNKYFCIWDAIILRNLSKHISDCCDLEEILITLSIYSILEKYSSICVTKILVDFQSNPTDNMRYTLSRHLSELILSNFELIHKSITRISRFNI
uniref:hypothetical protein n=1 Tax=uncultured Prochlorococcus sp. TaxID=159733 RepID=UPI00258AE170